MEIKPDEKKIVIYIESLSDKGNSNTKGDVEQYLSGQDEPAAQKIEIPNTISEEPSEEDSAE